MNKIKNYFKGWGGGGVTCKKKMRENVDENSSETMLIHVIIVYTYAERRINYLSLFLLRLLFYKAFLCFVFRKYKGRLPSPLLCSKVFLSKRWFFILRWIVASIVMLLSLSLSLVEVFHVKTQSYDQHHLNNKVP